MKREIFPRGMRPVALKAVSEVERARACPHRHASAHLLERARSVERANSTRVGAIAKPPGAPTAELGAIVPLGADDAVEPDGDVAMALPETVAGVEDAADQFVTEDGAPADAGGAETPGVTAGGNSNRGRRASRAGSRSES
jgi:hypothetical protein